MADFVTNRPLNQTYNKTHHLSPFETVYNEHYRSMYNVALKMINDSDAVRDIVQDVFVYYFQKTQNEHSIEKPKSWLMRATVNKCIDHLKSQKRYTPIENIAPIPVNNHETNEENTALKMALSKLKPNERALALLYSEGISYKEMAEITGTPFSSVGKTLSRTLKKLDTILKTMDYEVFR